MTSDEVRDAFDLLIAALHAQPKSREMAIVITHTETARLWFAECHWYYDGPAHGPYPEDE